MRKMLRLLVALPLLAWPDSAFAICPDCIWCQVEDNSDLDFGTYSVIDYDGKDAIGIVDLACNQTGERRGGSLLIQAGFNDMYGGHYEDHPGFPIWKVGPGQNGWPISLIYNLYHDPNHTVPYIYPNDGGDNPKVIPVSAGQRSWVGNGDFYGWIYPGQNPMNGHYQYFTYYIVSW